MLLPPFVLPLFEKSGHGILLTRIRTLFSRPANKSIFILSILYLLHLLSSILLRISPDESSPSSMYSKSHSIYSILQYTDADISQRFSHKQQDIPCFFKEEIAHKSEILRQIFPVTLSAVHGFCFPDVGCRRKPITELQEAERWHAAATRVSCHRPH